METVLVSGFDADNALMEKTRTLDDHSGIWGVIELWFSQMPAPASIKIECFDSADSPLHSFTVTPVT